MARMAEETGYFTQKVGKVIGGNSVAVLVEMEREIEVVRARLHRLVEQRLGDLTDNEVAELSSYLDHLIVKYELANTYRKKPDKLASV